MQSEAKYRIVLRDTDGFEIVNREAEFIGEAKRTARYMLSDTYAERAEGSHDDWRTEKVEIINRSGQCVWDKCR